MNNYGQTEYIVTKSQVFDAVRYGLECEFESKAIIDILMKPIESEIETVLEDDCEEMTDEMWEALRSYKGEQE